MKRLESLTKKLHQETLFTAYDDEFKEWELLDDLITSLDNEAEILPFIEESHHILAEGKFNLRGWKYTGDDDPEQVTSFLGLIWNRKEKMH
ncbi:integrase catalytic domain-containing protein [Trichonephila clavata]|uniref:Integrase catalytic domain-containing protein n=1 Tax=Trichonephila clavata TaxID=2740835 RepID=A0A8X6KED5_TRICU|nr:integrase catalytic domain-containing protein [Trichonephila clavata]